MQKIINIKKIDEKLLEEESEKRLLKSEEDYENGRYIDAEELFKEWNKKYGI